MAKPSSVTVLGQQQAANPLGGLGQAAVSGLSGVLQVLGQQKAEQLQHAQNRLVKYKRGHAYGLKPHELEFFADIPDEEERDFIQDINQRRMQQASELMPQNGGLQALQQQSQAQAPSVEQSLNQVLPPEQQEAAKVRQLVSEEQTIKDIGVAGNAPVQQQSVQKKALVAPAEQAYVPGGTKEQRALAHKEKQAANKESLKFYQDTLKEAKAADSNDKRLNRMEELLKKGKLTDPKIHALLNTLEHGVFGIGIDLHSLENADSQEFAKLSNDFLKDAKEIFGTRLTNFDVQAFLKTVPSLLQTDEGKQRVINNLKSVNEAVRERSKVMREIIKRNGGERPANLEELTDEAAAPILDALADDFKKGGPEKVNYDLNSVQTFLKNRGLRSGLFD